MLKKIQKLLLILCCVLGFSLFMIPNAKAFYPNNLYGDPNYVMASAHMGEAWYIRKDSLAKDLVKPPYNYKIVEIDDKYADCVASDFNQDLSFSIDKYKSRKEVENE